MKQVVYTMGPWTSINTLSNTVDTIGCGGPKESYMTNGDMALIISAAQMYDTILTFERFRNCPIVDDDFPAIRDEADAKLYAVLENILRIEESLNRKQK